MDQSIEMIIDMLNLCDWQMNKTSIVVDASKYIEELKQQVETLNQEIGTSEASTVENSLPVVHNPCFFYPHLYLKI